MSLYIGRVKGIGKNGEFAFIDFTTITRADEQKDLKIQGLRSDLFLHVNENQDLPRPLSRCHRESIIFEIDFDRRNSRGSPLVYNAQLRFQRATGK